MLINITHLYSQQNYRIYQTPITRNFQFLEVLCVTWSLDTPSKAGRAATVSCPEKTFQYYLVHPQPSTV